METEKSSVIKLGWLDTVEFKCNESIWLLGGINYCKVLSSKIHNCSNCQLSCCLFIPNETKYLESGLPWSKTRERQLRLKPDLVQDNWYNSQNLRGGCAIRATKSNIKTSQTRPHQKHDLVQTPMVWNYLGYIYNRYTLNTTYEEIRLDKIRTIWCPVVRLDKNVTTL